MKTYAVKVENGIAKIYDASNGAFQRSIGSNVVSAQITGEFVQVTDKNGRVTIFDASNGAFKRSL